MYPGRARDGARAGEGTSLEPSLVASLREHRRQEMDGEDGCHGGDDRSLLRVEREAAAQGDAEPLQLAERARENEVGHDHGDDVS